jgi:hypothetical protein
VSAQGRRPFLQGAILRLLRGNPYPLSIIEIAAEVNGRYACVERSLRKLLARRPEWFVVEKKWKGKGYLYGWRHERRRANLGQALLGAGDRRKQ